MRPGSIKQIPSRASESTQQIWYGSKLHTSPMSTANHNTGPGFPLMRNESSDLGGLMTGELLHVIFRLVLHGWELELEGHDSAGQITWHNCLNWQLSIAKIFFWIFLPKTREYMEIVRCLHTTCLSPFP